MWVIFVVSTCVFALVAALISILVWFIAHRVETKIKRENESFDVEKEVYKAKIKAEAEAEKTRIAAEAQAEANKELSSSITDELIRMKEAEAHYKNGWVTVQGASNTVVDATEK